MDYNELRLRFIPLKGLELIRLFYLHRIIDWQPIKIFVTTMLRHTSEVKTDLIYTSDDKNAEIYAKNIIGLLAKSHLKMRDIATVVNCKNCLKV